MTGGGHRLSALLLLQLLISAPLRLDAQSVASVDPMIGKVVPTFAWTSMDDSTSIVSPLSLQGAVVLVDLWGTWCGPCRREMPFLHEAYARFRSQGFEIVSVAFDVSPGKVQAYRREQFPMPWQHIFATTAIETEATRVFRVDSFPRTVLLDRDGRVLRVDAGLRGPALAATLDSVFSAQRSLPRRVISVDP